VAAASRAFRNSGWSTLGVKERATILHRLADLIDEKVNEIAQIESLDVGKPLVQPKSFDIPHAAKTFRYYADLSTKLNYREPLGPPEVDGYVLRKPYGVCGFILPWNFPFLLLGWNVAPALAAGNTIVIKPSEETPLSALYFAVLAKQAGVPDGVVNVVTGTGEEAGFALARHKGLARIAFTGSPEVGRIVAEAAGRNLIPCKLELGGKGAAVVFEDVDPSVAAAQLTNAITLNSGQVCCTATRWLIHESVYDRFIASATESLSNIRIGEQMDATTQMGPVISAKQRQRILDYLEKGYAQGATAILQSSEISGKEGFFITPALLTGGSENVCAQEEIFGPVAYVFKFKTEEEAIELVNKSNYGLANSVWSADLTRAARVSEALVAGNSWINGHNLFVNGVPYGGVNLSGFGGGVLGPEALTDYLRSQSVMRLR
jgi:aldehyde dehydrogenase (NAD+)